MEIPTFKTVIAESVDAGSAPEDWYVKDAVFLPETKQWFIVLARSLGRRKSETPTRTNQPIHTADVFIGDNPIF